MNIKTSVVIREACAYARDEMGLRLVKGGPWFEWDATKIIATDPIGAVILKAGALPAGLDPKRPESMVTPGLVEAACKTLDVDVFWLYRFWMGFDRGFQIQFFDKEEKKPPTKDDVSEFGITLAKELFRER